MAGNMRVLSAKCLFFLQSQASRLAGWYVSSSLYARLWFVLVMQAPRINQLLCSQTLGWRPVIASLSAFFFIVLEEQERLTLLARCLIHQTLPPALLLPALSTEFDKGRRGIGGAVLPRAKAWSSPFLPLLSFRKVKSVVLRLGDTFAGKVDVSAVVQELNVALSRGMAVLNEALLVALLTDPDIERPLRKTNVQGALDKVEKQVATLAVGVDMSVKTLIHSAIMTEAAKLALA